VKERRPSCSAVRPWYNGWVVPSPPLRQKNGKQKKMGKSSRLSGRKAAPATSVEQFFRLVSGDAARENWSSADLMSLYTAFAAVAVDRICQTASGIKTYLYYARRPGQEIRAYTTRPVAKSARAHVAGGYARLGIKAADIVEIEEHPLLEFLKGDDVQPGWRDIVSLGTAYELLIGNAYFLTEWDAGLLTSFLPLQSECINPVVDSRGAATSYVYRPTGTGQSGQEITYPASAITAFRLASPGPNLLSVGRGPLEKVVRNADLYDRYDRFESRLLGNNARPDFILNYKGNPSETEKRAVSRMAAKAFGGVNSGKPLISGGDLDVKELGFSPRELQYDKGRSWMMKVILAEFGLPESIALLNDANRASATVALQQFRSLTVNPLLGMFLEKFNRAVVQKYDPRLIYWYDDSEIYDPIEKAAAVTAEFTAGIITRDEARAELGYGAMGSASGVGDGPAEDGEDGEDGEVSTRRSSDEKPPEGV